MIRMAGKPRKSVGGMVLALLMLFFGSLMFLFGYVRR
jgi:hypothetical protein